LKLKMSISDVEVEPSKPILYSYWRSSCSYRVRISLAWKGVDFEYRAVNLSAKGQHRNDYERLNAMKAVPTLVVGGGGAALGQSLAILEYLEETSPEPALLPEGAVARARVRQLVSIICADTQPLQNSSVLAAVAPNDEEGQAAFARKWIERGLRGT
jgi:maleylacetoacetate isomerase